MSVFLVTLLFLIVEFFPLKLVAEKRQRKERQNVDDTHRAYQEASLLLLLLMLHCHCSRVQLYYSIFFNLHINDAAIIGRCMSSPLLMVLWR
ncbi:hypothetical protein GLYMA_20G183300v4 [Glycine max]|nr:hypothetical protein GLYMA_20G183300v4 [Glycine max]KAH1036761.1 hypothetical protein GYH30_056269 [Glycine max]